MSPLVKLAIYLSRAVLDIASGLVIAVIKSTLPMATADY